MSLTCINNQYTMWIMVKLVTNRNCLYQTAYHVIWCPKFRRDVLTGDVAVAVNQLLEAICCERRWPVIAKGVQPDHVHLFQRFPALKQRLWGGHLWSPSYYVGTAGTVSAATIERSEHVTKRR